MVNTQGDQVFDYDLYGKPISLITARILIAEVYSRGGTLEIAVANNAYCQAPIKGKTKWLAFPKEVWPEEWKKAGYKKPVVPLVRASAILPPKILF